MFTKRITLTIVTTTITLFLLKGLTLGDTCPKAPYNPEIDVNRLAKAIYIAEGADKTKHPYGILTRYKHTTPRQACINTINSALKRFRQQTKEKDFIAFLGATYCPTTGNLSRAEKALNRNWVKNVKFYYQKSR